eukprot:4299045-Prymnesium_polylepis.1
MPPDIPPGAIVRQHGSNQRPRGGCPSGLSALCGRCKRLRCYKGVQNLPMRPDHIHRPVYGESNGHDAAISPRRSSDQL